MNKKLLLAIPFVCLMTMGNQGCESSDTIQNRQQEQLAKQAAQTVGMPDIVNFQEKRMLKMIFELRDQSIVTYTYTQGIDGKMVFFCNSIGFPFPYATQYTNPVNSAGRPQADPNGLFSPSSAEGSWIACLDEKTKKVWPVYAEPKLTTSPFPLPTGKN
jgi:hypothetical protein